MKTPTIILALLFISCSSQSDLNQYMSTMGISLMDNCTVITSESSAAIGDMSVTYTFRVSDRDYESILKKIKSTEGFNDERMRHNNAGKYGYELNGKYGYDVVIEDNNGVNRYSIIINNDTSIVLTYVQE